MRIDPLESLDAFFTSLTSQEFRPVARPIGRTVSNSKVDGSFESATAQSESWRKTHYEPTR